LMGSLFSCFIFFFSFLSSSAVAAD
jgi:hypothetical protein